MYRIWASLCMCVLLLLSWPLRAHADGPFRLRAAADLPSWFTLALRSRVRFESASPDFRAEDAEPRALSLRTLLAAGVELDSFFGGVELMDARAYATDDTLLDTSHVDVFDILQAYVGVRRADLFKDRSHTELRVGRMTMNVGKRRLVARNDFRNTINAFTGVDANWRSQAQHLVRVFAVLPVTRNPSDADAVANNELELDLENTDSLLWGVFYGSPILWARAKLEIYAVGLHERDGEVASRNRQLVTPGLRAFRAPGLGETDFEIETALQLGSSRASRADDDTTDLDHRAVFVHAAAGATLDVAWSPRVVAQYDYASGDGDPDDGKNGHFYTLFGARRFDFGPTGIYGAFARGNLSTPGLRLEVAPHSDVDAFVGYRLLWLASSRDEWPTTGLRDATGASGSFLGQQAELRARWHVFPKNLSLEAGAALLIRGRFARDAMNGFDEGTSYVYTQVTGSI